MTDFSKQTDFEIEQDLTRSLQAGRKRKKLQRASKKTIHADIDRDGEKASQ